MEACSEEALKLVWEGAIPLQICLHESEVTTLPAPPPAIVLGPRIGYLPLLIPLIKPHFSSTLPPGVDTTWFDYKGLPLKWYIPTGVLFDLLCADPERPWNLTVHFRGYPGEILNPCEGEDSVKWSFINSLKEAAYIINGNCKNVMNMSQADQFELWQSLVKGNMDSYRHISSKLKLGPLGKDCLVRTVSSLVQSRQSFGETDNVGSNRAGRIPVRLYVRTVDKDLDDLEDVAAVDSWDSITYINRPLEIYRQDGNYITLKSAIKTLLPEFFDDETSKNNQSLGTERDYHESDSSLGETDAVNIVRNVGEEATSSTSQTEMQSSKKAKIKLIRIQGVELDSNIPFYWVVNNLMHPEYYLHICVFLGGLAH